MTKPKRKVGSSVSSITDEASELNFLPENLPDHILDQLWLIADRQGETGLRDVIQEERYRRLENEVKGRRYAN